MALFDSVVVIARSYTALPPLTPSESIRRDDSADMARRGQVCLAGELAPAEQCRQPMQLELTVLIVKSCRPACNGIELVF
jgi:hypothetical protein